VFALRRPLGEEKGSVKKRRKGKRGNRTRKQIKRSIGNREKENTPKILATVLPLITNFQTTTIWAGRLA